MPRLSPDAQLADAIADFYDDPLGYVMFCFPWDTDPAIQVVDWTSDEIEESTGKPYHEVMAQYRGRFNSQFGPDLWACEFLDSLGVEIRKRSFDGTVAVDPIQYATSSGHGIGKTVMVAWLIKFIMDTRPFSKGTVTANTEAQLRTKTWAELGKWHRRSLTSHWFEYNSGRGSMSLKHIKHKEEWYCSAQTCREENSEAFAGQHAANSTSFYIFDEASAVPDKIYEVREGGTTDGEPMTFDFGNPTRNSGRFYEECEGKFKHRYLVRKIDSRRVFITNKKRLKDWVDDYGEESDFVKVRIRGEFPSQGSLQFIPTSWVHRACLRETITDRFAPLTIGVDVARFGDDSSVIYPVLGNDARSFAPRQGDGIYQGLDNVQLAQKVIEKIEFFRSMGIEPAAVFIDVGGTGSGVVDTLRHSGYDMVVEVNFGTTPVFEPDTYRYRSDEMWGRMREAIKTKLILPVMAQFQSEGLIADNPGVAQQLSSELTQREFGYTISGNKVHMETKKDMKSRGLSSPDIADGLALNFAQDVAVMTVPHGSQQKGIMSIHEFDPLEGINVN